MDDAAETNPETAATGEPADGMVTLRGALGGLVLLWLAAIAAFGAVQAAIYGAMTSPIFVVAAAGAIALSVTAGYASLRAFGLK